MSHSYSNVKVTVSLLRSRSQSYVYMYYSKSRVPQHSCNSKTFSNFYFTFYFNQILRAFIFILVGFVHTKSTENFCWLYLDKVHICIDYNLL